MTENKTYNPSEIEAHWQNEWEKSGLYNIDLKKAKKPYYTHVMFPYPSGDKLHVGHWFNFGPCDSYARFKRLQGYDVFSPIGFDSFGLPAENYAIKTGVPPQVSIKENVNTMTEQFKRMGCMYDWSKSLSTSTPEYYKWTQFIFLKLYEKGLAYQKEAMVNWDPVDQTVLANEQVLPDGTAERSGAKVIQKPLKQWFFKITDYNQALLDGLDDLDWPPQTKVMQKNWIGRSEGSEIDFPIIDTDKKITVYTTRIDTIFSATYVILAPEHPYVEQLKDKIENWDEVKKYIDDAANKTEIDRTAETNKSGVQLKGLSVFNPATDEEMPLWISDFVLAHYGTGAVFADAHDSRDFEMAKIYNIPLKISIHPKDADQETIDKINNLEECFTEYGILLNSGQFDGLTSEEARPKITEWLEEKGSARFKTNYKMRDWLLSRQRYWGAPIPIVFDPDGNPHPVPEKHLPWMLPDDVEFKPEGHSPLAQSEELKKRTEEIFGKGWTPEVDTMDTFVCSSFYSIRYLSDGSQEQFVDPEIEKKWMPLDCYIGGTEHACMHLIYARFIQRALKDAGIVSNAEPYHRLIHQGTITKDGSKMSKSRGNVVSPDGFVEKHGSDVFRMYLMFMGPYEQGGDWSDSGINGTARFANKAYNFFANPENYSEDQASAETIKVLHQTIKKVTHDTETFGFNTAISALMVLLNQISADKKVSQDVAQKFTILLSPFAPHLAEEIWRNELKQTDSVFNETWPEYDEELAAETEIEIAIQINGKVRGTIQMAAGVSKKEIEDSALDTQIVKKYLSEGELRKTIVVPEKLVNFVIN